MNGLLRRYAAAIGDAAGRTTSRSTASDRMNGLVGLTLVVLLTAVTASMLVEAGSPLAQLICLPLAAVTVVLTVLMVLELGAALRREA
ncbi:hypothetical protein GJ689_16660 [Rhodoplanes serenus]|uniref:Uncharacterized protein n=1 Tax=Rhodoplanes serenus TaxID=200615 RepID=A0A9X4XPF0_9BRAD|nr:hypothetical protein [Rhodoplanes serenus]MTW17841.1 hypothetical protein [Rhodoplanes serenus]